MHKMNDLLDDILENVCRIRYICEMEMERGGISADGFQIIDDYCDKLGKVIYDAQRAKLMEANK